MNKSISHYDNNVISLRLDLVCADGGTQMREALSPATVSEYAEALRAGAKFPPIDVFYDGSDYWPADGFHRLEAHHQAGLQEIDADVHDGAQRDAMLYAAGANADHGLRRSSEDKKRAVLTLLRDPEWRQWSDREIAGRVKVDHKTVAKYRRELDGEFPIETERRFTSRHGTEAKRTVANGASVKPGNESEEPVADVDKIPCGAEVVSASANCNPATSARLASQDRWEEPSKRQRVAASDARAAENRIKKMVGRLAALSAQERAIVIEVASDRWGAPLVDEPVPDEEQSRADASTELDDAERGVKANEPSETPEPQERDNGGEGMRRDHPQRRAMPVGLQIFPDFDPYNDREPVWVRGGLQSLGFVASVLPYIPNRDRVTALVLESIDLLAPALLQIPIPKEQQNKIISLLRSYCGYKNFADQLLDRWAEEDAANDGAQAEMFPYQSSSGQ